METKKQYPFSTENFTPAAGRAGLTGIYDLALRFVTREKRWRSLLLSQVNPANGQNILDVGCGTGTFALMMKRRAPSARIVAIDPDQDVFSIARAKAAKAGVEIEWRQGFARDAALAATGFDKAVSSLVFHQVPLAEKRAGIAAMFSSVRSGGEVHIADYAVQPSFLMRRLFRVVQQLDGYEQTQANVDGALERIMSSEAGEPVCARHVLGTPTGAISLFQATAR